MLAEGFCTRAEAAGLLGEESATWSEFAPKLGQHVDDLLGPHCAGWGERVFTTQGMQYLGVEITSAEWGREFCRAFFDDQYFEQDGTWTRSAMSQFDDDHPDLSRPVLIAGMMDKWYDASVGVSRATFRKVLERSVDEALPLGIITMRVREDYVPGTTNVIGRPDFVDQGGVLDPLRRGFLRDFEAEPGGGQKESCDLPEWR